MRRIILFDVACAKEAGAAFNFAKKNSMQKHDDELKTLMGWTLIRKLNKKIKRCRNGQIG
jgi:hypothetical protein